MFAADPFTAPNPGNYLPLKLKRSNLFSIVLLGKWSVRVLSEKMFPPEYFKDRKRQRKPTLLFQSQTVWIGPLFLAMKNYGQLPRLKISYLFVFGQDIFLYSTTLYSPCHPSRKLFFAKASAFYL